MIFKKIDFAMDVTLSDRGLCHNVARNNYYAKGYIRVNTTFNGKPIKMPLSLLWEVLESQDLREIFRESSTKCIRTMKKDFSNMCEGKVLERDTISYDYLKDVCVDYYEGKEDSYFCILVCAKNGLENMEQYWNLFLNKEWEKYENRDLEEDREV